MYGNTPYLIPANTKKGALIFNLFRPVDLILFGSGIFISIILLLILPTEELSFTIIALAPALIAGFLVTPIPNYHNVITVISTMLSFYIERRRYIWKGWCVYEQFAETKKR